MLETIYNRNTIIQSWLEWLPVGSTIRVYEGGLRTAHVIKTDADTYKASGIVKDAVFFAKAKPIEGQPDTFSAYWLAFSMSHAPAPYVEWIAGQTDE